MNSLHSDAMYATISCSTSLMWEYLKTIRIYYRQVNFATILPKGNIALPQCKNKVTEGHVTCWKLVLFMQLLPDILLPYHPSAFTWSSKVLDDIHHCLFLPITIPANPSHLSELSWVEVPLQAIWARYEQYKLAERFKQSYYNNLFEFL